MDKLQKRRELNMRRTMENRRYKFIAEYIKAKHHDIYTEADQVYQTVKDKNPSRKDMTKTVDFLKITTPYTSFPVYYYSRRKSAQKNKGNTPPRQSRNTLNMVLNIPLLSSLETPTRNDETQPPTIPDQQLVIPEQQPDIPEQQLVIPEQQPDIPDQQLVIPEQQPDIPDQQLVIPEQQPDIPDQQLAIPDSVYEDILRELRRDPDLYRIFNHMDIPDNQETIIQDNDDMNKQCNDDMWDTFNVSEITPLERELMEQGF